MPDVRFQMPLKLHSRDGRWRCARASANTCTSANTLTITHARTSTRTRTQAQDTPLPKRILSLIPGTPDTPWCACALHSAHTETRTRAPRSAREYRELTRDAVPGIPPKQTGAALRRTHAHRCELLGIVSCDELLGIVSRDELLGIVSPPRPLCPGILRLRSLDILH